MLPRVRIGLRAQIVLALSLVFAASFWLAGFTTLALGRRSAELAAAHERRSLARLVQLAVDAPDGAHEAALAQLCAGLLTRTGVHGLRVRRSGAPAFECGEQRGGSTRVGTVELWSTAQDTGVHGPVTGLLLFYLALTGVAVLLLSYVSLTYLVVRPLERLTRSAQELAKRGEHVLVPEQGSAEAARLGRTFNEMAAELRAERRRLVDRLAELERTTSELRDKEQQLIHGEKLASIGRLAAGVAHEIGNPLAAILGLLELLEAGGLSEDDAREFLARIHRETERINGIIRDLLDFARRDAHVEMAGQTAELREVIADAVSLVRPQKESKDIAISVAIDPATRRVQGAQQRLTQVVLNLLLNAVDALGGKGTIEIRVQPSADDAYVTLVVDDDGPGLAPAIVDRLFEPFSTTKPAGKGTGLGLAVAHSIVDGMGGAIEGCNRPGGGARFTVRLRQQPAKVVTPPV